MAAPPTATLAFAARLRAAVAATVEAAEGGTLSGVAHALGFADEPHYGRAVRRAIGMPPGALRALAASLPYDVPEGGPPQVTHPGGRPPDRG